MRLTKCVYYTIFCALTHSCSSKIVSRRIRWSSMRRKSTNGLIERFRLSITMLAHSNIVGVIVKMHIGHRQPMRISNSGIQSHPVVLLRQIDSCVQESSRIAILIQWLRKICALLVWIDEVGEESTS